MIKFLKKIQKNIFTFEGVILVLIAIVFILAYRQWIYPFGILTKGDWSFFFNETAITLRQYYFSVWLSDNSFGRVLTDVGQTPSYFLYGVFSRFLGVGYEITERLVHFWPAIFIAPLSSYFLCKEFLMSRIAIIVGVVVYCFNTYFLNLQTGHLTLMVAFSVAPFVLYFFKKTLESTSLYYASATALFAFFCAAYEPRVFYILMMLLFLFYGFFFLSSKKRNLSELIKVSFFAATPIILVCFLNLYWVLGLSQIGALTENDLFNRGLFGSQFWTILYSITLHHPWWSDTGVKIFENQKIFWFFWIVPIFAVFGWVSQRKNKFALFFLMIGLIGVFLSKQAGAPFEGVYLWMYEHVPGFNAFREATKFYFLIVLSYSLLIGYGVDWLYKNRKKSWVSYLSYGVSVSVILCLFIWNTKPLISGEADSLFVARTVPRDYEIFKEYMLKQGDFSRILWVPKDPRFGIYTDLHSRLSMIDLVQSSWKFMDETQNMRSDKEMQQVIEKQAFDTILDVSSVGYVVVPLRDYKNDDDFFIHYGGRENPNIRQWYIGILDRIPSLKRINIGTSELVVYKNNEYRGHIYAFNNLFNLESASDLNGSFNFVSKQLLRYFYFFVDKENTSQSPSSTVKSIFSYVYPSYLRDGGAIHSEVYNDDSGNKNLYVNPIEEGFSVIDSGNLIELERQPVGSLKVNNALVYGGTTSAESLASLETGGSIERYIVTGTEYTKLEKNRPTRLPKTGDTKFLRILSTGKNLLLNSSFETKPWQLTVGDCNNFDNQPDIAMKLSSQDASDGKRSMLLEATRHIACASTMIPLAGSGEYVLSFDHMGSGTEVAGYYVSLDDSSESKYENGTITTSGAWSTYTQSLVIPEGATFAHLYVYAKPPGGGGRSYNYYDNFHLEKVEHTQKVELASIPKYKQIPIDLQPGTNTFEYSEEGYDYKNEIENGSFEEGMWQEKVGDCNNFDELPVLDMRLTGESKTDGDKSLELEATRHTACTTKKIPVQAGQKYLLSFDYQSPNAKFAKYYVGFNDQEKSAFSENLDIKDTDWHSFSRTIEIPKNATQMTLFVYAFSVDEEIPIVNRYDNVSLVRIPDIESRYYFYSEVAGEMQNPQSITYEPLSPTKKLVHVRGASTPFYLAMSESFHPQWKLEFANKKNQGIFNGWVPWAKPDSVPDTAHIKLNNFLNAWYVNTTQYCSEQSKCTVNGDGTYDMEFVIEFFPQRWFYFGLIISCATLALCVDILLFYRIRQKYASRKNNKQKKI